MNKQKKRNEIDSKYKWAIEDLLLSDEDWMKELEETKGLIKDISKYQGKLGESADTLFNFLVLKDKVSHHFERVYVYAHQKYHEDTSVSTYQDYQSRASSLGVLLESSLSFATPEILGIEEDKLYQFIKENEGLKQYEFMLKEILRKKPHTLSAEMECS